MVTSLSGDGDRDRSQTSPLGGRRIKHEVAESRRYKWFAVTGKKGRHHSNLTCLSVKSASVCLSLFLSIYLLLFPVSFSNVGAK